MRIIRGNLRECERVREGDQERAREVYTSREQERCSCYSG